GEGADLVVVQPASRDRLLEDRGVGRHPAETVFVDETRELARSQQIARDVVVPGTLTKLPETNEWIRHVVLAAKSRRTIAAARSAVKLNSSKSRSPGAEAPKPGMV